MTSSNPSKGAIAGRHEYGDRQPAGADISRQPVSGLPRSGGASGPDTSARASRHLFERLEQDFTDCFGFHGEP